MRQILQIFTHNSDPWTDTVLEEESRNPDIQVRRIDLRGPEPSYDTALDEILRADAVQIF